jgi:hypothetical protein
MAVKQADDVPNHRAYVTRAPARESARFRASALCWSVSIDAATRFAATTSLGICGHLGQLFERRVAESGEQVIRELRR